MGKRIELCVKGLAVAVVMAVSSAMAFAQEERREVMLETSLGNVRIALYNETPAHRDNFLRLVESGFYNGIAFHRVIYGFMIQAGDPATRDSTVVAPQVELKKIPAEIHFPQLFHKRGCLAAAREGDNVNPERMSSASQFYIVYGKRHDDAMLDRAQQQLDKNTQSTVVLPPEVREEYKRIGGTPHLDGQYTVFGEVLEGLDVVRDIDWVPTDDQDRPVDAVRIIRAYILK
ncbi:MAG: peptidylprolyl isomerase [Prevotella sp.]|nr:peptidylprolyl isomerase [Prevotella sp.]